MDFEQFVINPAALMALIFGLVEFAKQLGASGHRLRWLSMLTGIILAVVYRLRGLYPQAAPWIDISFFGLAAGLAASGVFDFIQKRIPGVS
jgi:uncharacterized membrane protein HdeD (DUF308 family)